MFAKLKQLREGLFFLENEKRFLNFLKNDPINSGEGEPIVLVEFSKVFSNIIGLYFFLYQLRKKTKAAFWCYLIRPKKVYTPFFVAKYLQIYRRLGISRFLYCYPDDSFDHEINECIKKEKILSLTKKEIEEFKINGVWIGDLVYDSYLYKTSTPTIEVSSQAFLDAIKEALYYFFYWQKVFSENKCSSLIVSHTVYAHFAIALRVAVSKGIDVFQVNDSGLYRLNEKRVFAYHEFFDFKNIYNSLPKGDQSEGLDWARQRLNKRFGGEVGVDMHYSTKSAWTSNETCPEIIASDKIKVFIALHCFFDSPHPYGLNLFPDFWEWLNFVGEISKKTDYEWYLKTHPDFLPGNDCVVEALLKKYPKFKLLPPTTSHHSIIKSGINYVLTVYGTVGMEYAYFNIPVINASQNNIHCAFNFNLHPKTIQEYEKYLLDLGNTNLTINREEILQYYFVKNKVCQQSWIWDNLEDMFKYIGGENQQRTSNILDYFFHVYSKQLLDKAHANARNFLESKEYCMFNKYSLKDC